MKRRQFLQGAAAAALFAPAMTRGAFAQAANATVMKMAPQANLTSLDPIWTTATVTNNHGYYVFDTLYGGDLDLKPQPQMAEGHEISADGKVWKIKLREGLAFHDGQPVRPADCIQSLKRWCQRDPYGQLLIKAVEAWGAPDERTIEIKLTRPFPMMLDCLAKADNPPFIMPERLAQTDATKQVTEMTGSGPYKFIAAEYVTGSRVVYEKNEAYKPRSEPPSRNAGGKVAHFKRIEWPILPDPATAAAALTKGEIDWWERPLADLQPLLARSPDVTREVIDKNGRGSIMRLNHLQPPF
ncbi:MAG TPA: ABC transporter substrate-binding protein, partial [Bosea sp. (in: a-proteobacteria)]|uniref:ABC transporter substrate-binding protein n=1 Tax=Bosea sp. (in: a-proteobacteria) TaxID=1871050 RepID=UPI002E136969|nr:ABC transporter substrate-binding protein [Bosea sp. (in: a-proteobacteria)]